MWPSTLLCSVSKDAHEKQTFEANLHLFGWWGDNCNEYTHLCSVSKDVHERLTYIKPTCIEVEVGDNCVQFIKMLMKGKHLKPSCIEVEVEIKKR